MIKGLQLNSNTFSPSPPPCFQNKQISVKIMTKLLRSTTQKETKQIMVPLISAIKWVLHILHLKTFSTFNYEIFIHSLCLSSRSTSSGIQGHQAPIHPASHPSIYPFTTVSHLLRLSFLMKFITELQQLCEEVRFVFATLLLFYLFCHKVLCVFLCSSGTTY